MKDKKRRYKKGGLGHIFGEDPDILKLHFLQRRFGKSLMEYN